MFETMTACTRWLQKGFAGSIALLMAGSLSIGLTQATEQAPLGWKTRFTYRVDAVDPTPQSNPAGAQEAGARGRDQLVIYTPSAGSATRTHRFGEEAIVVDQLVEKITPGNASIPANGFVVSGHGRAANWMSNLLKPGARVTWQPGSRELTVELTPRIHLISLQKQLKELDGRPPLDASTFDAYRSEGQACYLELLPQADAPLTPAFVQQALVCEQQLNRAYYATVPTVTPRGVWVRPTERTPEAIAKTLDKLQALSIDAIYVETYYQGKTIFPSKTMAAYGLPDQHNQFKGRDPLQEWITAAHARNIKVHAWVQTFFAGNERENAETFGPILNKYPHWRNVQRQYASAMLPVPSPVEEGHFFLDPAHPEVQTFLEKLFVEIVSHYEVDGLNLDYIRYPASHPVAHKDYLPSTWGYGETARERFRTEMVAEAKGGPEKTADGKPTKPAAKVTPKLLDPKTYEPLNLTLSDPLWPRWVAWRKQQVNNFVLKTSAKVRSVRPGLTVSAVVFPKPDAQFALKLQEWPVWVKAGAVQALTPIGLSPDPAGMYQHCLQFKQLTEGKVPVYIGVFGLYNRLTPKELVQQIESVKRANMAGVVLFDPSRMNAAYEEALLTGPFRIQESVPSAEKAVNPPDASATPPVEAR